MSRPIADTPPLAAEQESREKPSVSWSPLSLEMQLWIEVALLVGFGLIMIYSASSIMALKRFSDPSYYMKRQFLCIGLGLVVALVSSRFPYRMYRQYVGWMFLATILALILVLIPGLGVKVNNARRWFQILGFSLQPGEYAKVVWILFLSVSIVKKQDRIKKLSVSFYPHMFLCGIMGVLLLKEPDFGTTFLIGCLTMILMAVGGVPCRTIFMLAPFVALFFYKFVYLVEYRWERITAFLDPWGDQLGSGYQLIQAWIAVGSGGLFGKGLGAGQQKLFYLPESYTDFIMAVVGEELGFMGIATVCLLFFFLYRTGIKISKSAPDLLGALMALGLTMMLSLQALLNMSVVLGLIPTKGLPLPFISYGGSAFLANCLAVGILMNIAKSGDTRVE
ncbi:MAG: putative lipid II flippase FtsW [Acidobacteriota bacterium]